MDQAELDWLAYRDAGGDTEIDDAQELQAWMSFEKDPKVWSEYLTQSGVDLAAQRMLFCLAQVNYDMANELIHAFLQSQSDGKEIKNPSGYIHSGVMNARKHLNIPSGVIWR